MKKTIALLLALICISALSACTISITTDDTPSNGGQSTDAATTAKPSTTAVPKTAADQQTGSATTAKSATEGTPSTAAPGTAAATTVAPTTTAATGQPTDDDGSRVTEEEWNALFSVENIVFHSNYKMTVSVPENEWEATLSFDNGKLYLTGLGLRKGEDSVEQPVEQPVEQRTDGYLYMKSLSDGEATIVEYRYWGKWIAEEETYNLTEYFRSFVLFELPYKDFVFDEETHEYKKPATEPDDPEDAGDAIYDAWTVKIRDNKIVEETVLHHGMLVTVTCSDYGQIHVTFPEIEE